MKRHNSRILSVMILFNMDMNQVDLGLLTEEGKSEIVDNVINVIQDDEYKVEIDYALTDTIVNNIILHYEDIKALICDSLTNWTIDRLSYVDRAILFSATSEMMMNIAPKQVIINEYLDITREYSMVTDEKQVKFNNRVLDVIANKVYE